MEDILEKLNQIAEKCSIKKVIEFSPFSLQGSYFEAQLRIFDYKDFPVNFDKIHKNFKTCVKCRKYSGRNWYSIRVDVNQAYLVKLADSNQLVNSTLNTKNYVEKQT